MAYVYRIEVNGIPRYIGKGTGSRAWRHLLGGKQDGSRICQRVAAAAKRGDKVDVKIIADNLSDEAAFDLEARLIASVGKVIDNTGPLWNIADGGLGGTSEAAKRRWSDPAFRAKMSEVNSEAQKRSKKNREHIQRLATDEGVKQKRLKSWTPERAAALAELNRAKVADPEFRKAHKVRMKKAHNRPEVRAVKSAAAKKAMADPATRALISERCKLAWERRMSDPVERKKITENARRAAKMRFA